MSKATKESWTKLFTIGEAIFYEDPESGDEAPIWMEYKDMMYLTDWWDKPSVEEVEEFLKVITGGYEPAE